MTINSNKKNSKYTSTLLYLLSMKNIKVTFSKEILYNQFLYYALNKQQRGKTLKLENDYIHILDFQLTKSDHLCIYLNNS